MPPPQNYRLSSSGSWSLASGTGSVSGSSTESWSFAGQGSFAEPLAMMGNAQGPCSASAGQSYSLGYSAQATLVIDPVNGNSWSYAGSGLASGSASFHLSYSGSVSGSTFNADGSGTAWTINESNFNGSMNGTNTGSSVYNDPFTIGPSGSWQSNNQTLSSSSQAVSHFGYHLFNESGNATASDGPIISLSYGELIDITSNVATLSTSTTVQNTAGASTTSSTTFDGNNGGTAGAWEYNNGNPYVDNDTWTAVSATQFQQTGSNGTYSYGPGNVTLTAQPQPGFSGSPYTFCLGGMEWEINAPLTSAVGSGFSTSPPAGGVGTVPAAGAFAPLGETLLGNGGGGLPAAVAAAPAGQVLSQWPAAVDAVWGMAFTPANASRTPFAVGNIAGTLTSEKMKGADAVLGPDNVAAVVPVTDSVIVVGYGLKGVAAGANAPVTGSTDSSDSATDPLANDIVPVTSSATQSGLYRGGGGGIELLANGGSPNVPTVQGGPVILAQRGVEARFDPNTELPDGPGIGMPDRYRADNGHGGKRFAGTVHEYKLPSGKVFPYIIKDGVWYTGTLTTYYYWDHLLQMWVPKPGWDFSPNGLRRLSPAQVAALSAEKGKLDLGRWTNGIRDVAKFFAWIDVDRVKEAVLEGKPDEEVRAMIKRDIEVAIAWEAAGVGVAKVLGVVGGKVLAGLSGFFARRATAAEKLAAALARKVVGTEGLEHSFGAHAAQWTARYGGSMTKAAWQKMIETAMKSKLVVEWSLKGKKTVAYLARIDGNKWFVVQFYAQNYEGCVAGELATAFIPNKKQLAAMLRALGR